MDYQAYDHGNELEKPTAEKNLWFSNTSLKSTLHWICLIHVQIQLS